MSFVFYAVFEFQKAQTFYDDSTMVSNVDVIYIYSLKCVCVIKLDLMKLL